MRMSIGKTECSIVITHLVSTVMQLMKQRNLKQKSVKEMFSIFFTLNKVTSISKEIHRVKSLIICFAKVI